MAGITTNGTIHTIGTQTNSLELIHHGSLPVFQRKKTEAVEQHGQLNDGNYIPYNQTAEKIKESSLPIGSQDLLIGLLRLGSLMQFPGGYGIDYASLLKTGVWPQYTSSHIHEVGTYLNEQKVDYLVAPGISGHPIAAQYAEAAKLPALLLTKEHLPDNGSYPEGSFKIPSYTGGKDVVIHPDPKTVIELLRDVTYRQLEEQKQELEPIIQLRVGIGDDIIDQGVMSLALGDSSERLGKAAVTHIINNEYRKKTNDNRKIQITVKILAFVTPIKKAYNHPGELLEQAFGIRPHAGVKINALYPGINVIDVDGVGKVQFKT